MVGNREQPYHFICFSLFYMVSGMKMIITYMVLPYSKCSRYENITWQNHVSTISENQPHGKTMYVQLYEIGRSNHGKS